MKWDASVNMFITKQNINNFSICIPAFCLVIKQLDMKWFNIGVSISCGRHWSTEIINLVAQFFFYHPSKFNHMFSSRFIYLNCIYIYRFHLINTIFEIWYHLINMYIFYLHPINIVHFDLFNYIMISQLLFFWEESYNKNILPYKISYMNLKLFI